MSLELKLPLLMSAVLAIVLTIMVAVTYTTLRRNVISSVEERVARATRQLATVSATAVFGNQARYLRVGNDSAVRRALRNPSRADTAAVRMALARAALATDSGMPVELWTADGHRVAFSGNDVRTVPLVAPGRPELPRRIASTFDTTSSITAPDSMRVGPIYFEGDRLHLWFVQPIRDRDSTVGYITHQRRISTGPNTQRVLQDLSGDSVQVFYRNLDRSLWATMAGKPMEPLSPISATIAKAPEGGEVVVHEQRIGATPLVVGMKVPVSSLLIRPKRTIRTIILLSLALMLAGALASWMVSRSVARPLTDLTQAASMMATGDYAVRVPESGDEEVRRLASTFNHMAGEIGSSRSALEHQTQQAQAASSAKSEFLTTMSHELRTPLNAIGGYVELLEMELRGPVTEMQRRDLERIKASQQHLLGLISGVLDLARVEAGKVSYDMANVAVDPFLAGIDTLIAPQAASKSVTMEYKPCPGDLAIVADREKLRQILLNLLSNAIRHTPKDGRVKLSAEIRTGKVAIVVEDTGPGIPRDKREIIFEPFVQLDRSLTQMREGLGLGLAISRDLARGMYGDLVVEDSRGVGSRFVLTLPMGNVDGALANLRSDEMPAVTTRE
jgi:signal transduction histidine kinase